MPNSIAKVWKAILAFVSLVGANVINNIVTGNGPLPQTSAQWFSLIGTTIVGTFLVWAKSNSAANTPNPKV